MSVTYSFRFAESTKRQTESYNTLHKPETVRLLIFSCAEVKLRPIRTTRNVRPVRPVRYGP